jgi:hypothetical protein
MSTAIKESPIRFNGPMVRAMLDGSKTQTRRIAKNRKDPDIGCDMAPCEIAGEPAAMQARICPYGQPGERLWVRETWQGPMWEENEPWPENAYLPAHCQYAADGGRRPEYVDADDNYRQGWRPSIHMPRWASRILLEIVSVSVERLNDISAEDARAEGVDAELAAAGALHGPSRTTLLPVTVHGFAHLWESINGAGSWDANPWVWVIEFRRVV